MGERIGMRWGLWVARAEGGLLAAPTLPRAPNCRALLLQQLSLLPLLPLLLLC